MSGRATLRVIRTESEVGRWEVASRPPHPRLRPHVIGYVGLNSAMDVRRERHLPSGEAALVVNLAAPHHVIDPNDRSRDLRLDNAAIMGVHDRPFLTESDGLKHVIVVRLTPPGAQMLFGVPMKHLFNRWVGLDQIDKSLARDIADRAPQLQSWDGVFSFLDGALAERLGQASNAESMAAWAWSRLRASSGRLFIGSLRRDLDLSHKQLLTQFREHIGMLPKETGELARFNRVLRKSRDPFQPRFATLALECGYHDQAHMSREFKTFAHGTPSEIRRMVAGFTLREPD